MLFVKGKQGYRQVTADGLKEMLKSAHAEVSTATSYADGYVRHDTICDTSEDAPFRIAFVKKAEAQFIEEHRREILQRAADLIAADIRNLEN